MQLGDRDFQKMVLVSLMKSRDLYTGTVKYMKPEYFGPEDYRDIMLILSEFYDKYCGAPPSLSSMVDFINNNGSDGNLISLTKELYSIKIRDIQYVTERITDFIKHQEWKLFQSEIPEALRNGSFELLKNRAFDIADIGLVKGNGVYDFFTNIDTRFEKDSFHSRAIGTGIKSLDPYLDNGGLAAGELGIIFAPPSGGKSTFLVNIGKYCLIGGNHVIHFSEEMSDMKTARRYDQCITGMTKEEIRRTPIRIKNKILEFQDSISKRLLIQEHPTGTCTVNQLDNEIETMINRTGITPDVIIVDYADLLATPRKYDEKRHELTGLYQGLRGLAVKYKTRVWTASQSQRSTIKSSGHIGMEHVAEDIGKAAIADVMISVKQTIEEKKMKRGEAFIAKNRDGERDVSVPVYINWSRVQISDLRR